VRVLVPEQEPGLALEQVLGLALEQVRVLEPEQVRHKHLLMRSQVSLS
jgi:hypothetical protein